jgi:hypothetical protein
VPETWRCECGYTNMNTKACLVCRRPRQAVTVSIQDEPLAEVTDPEPESELVTGPPAEVQRPKRPLRASRPTKKAPPRSKTD